MQKASELCLNLYRKTPSRTPRDSFTQLLTVLMISNQVMRSQVSCNTDRMSQTNKPVQEQILDTVRTKATENEEERNMLKSHMRAQWMYPI